MTTTQLSVFLENKPQRLAHVLGILAGKGINIQTLTIAEVNDFGILRMIVDQPEAAHVALRASHVTCSQAEVLAVALEDTPGALFRLIDTFSSKHQINIEYMYAFSGRHDARSIMIFRFEDVAAARSALQEDGYQILPWIGSTGGA